MGRDVTDRYRPPTEAELEEVETAYNEYYSYGDHWSLSEYEVVVVEEYETDGDTYSGRLAIVVDGGANATTYGFTDDGAVLVSDALNEKEGLDTF